MNVKTLIKMAETHLDRAYDELPISSKEDQAFINNHLLISIAASLLILAKKEMDKL